MHHARIGLFLAIAMMVTFGVLAAAEAADRCVLAELLTSPG